MTALARTTKAPFPWFGGKSTVAAVVWARLGRPKQYLEPFCGSAAVLLAAPQPAPLEIIGDQNCFVANFWRALKCRTDDVWAWQDYPVSHVDLAARHAWLTDPERVSALRESLFDPEWPGDAHVAGWWLWGQCCWIGSGWADPTRGQRRKGRAGGEPLGQIPHAGNAGMGVQAVSLGKIPHAGDAGRGVHEWLSLLSSRLARVRIVHGDWSRCLNHHYGGNETALFLDPPYRAFEGLYSDGSEPVADQVAAWAAEHAHLRVALCGHRGDYQLDDWTVYEWERARNTYGGDATKDAEAIWFSPACESPQPVQTSLFGGVP